MVFVPLALSLVFATRAPLAVSTQDIELESFQRNVARLIERHAHLPRLGLEAVWGEGDFACLVQVPGTAGPEFLSEAVARQLERGGRIERAFEQLLGEPFELRLRPGAPRMVVVALAGSQEFAEYYLTTYGAQAGSRHVYYDLGSRLLVVGDSPGELSSAGRLLERHERALQVLHAHGPSAMALPGPYWFQQGMAQELCGRNDPEGLLEDGFSPSGWTVAALAKVMASEPERSVRLLPVEEFLVQTHYQGVLESMRTRASEQETSPSPPWELHGTFVDQAGALVGYLLRVADDDLRGRMQRFCEASMKGDRAGAEGAFADLDLAAVEAGFWTWVWRAHARRGTEGPRDEVLEGFLVERFGARPFPVRLAPSAFEARDLVRNLDDAEGRLALALAWFETGAAERARSLLLEAAKTENLTGDTRRLLRELARIEAWIAARDGFAEHLVESGELLRLGVPEVKSRVKGFDAGRLLFEDETQEPLLLQEIVPLELARAMTARRSKYEAPWGAVYPLVLAREEGIERLLKGDEIQLRMLASDGERDYVARRIQIDAAVVWRRLVEGQGEPLELVARLWATRDAVPFVAGLEVGLRQLSLRELEEQGHDGDERRRRMEALGFAMK